MPSRTIVRPMIHLTDKMEHLRLLPHAIGPEAVENLD